jgi:hypothetical protein
MDVYELTHLFFLHAGELEYSPKKLGLFYSSESVRQAIQYYRSKPGFQDNPEAFSIRIRSVSGSVTADMVYEAVVYLHSEDYDFETEIQLGLYGDETMAQYILAQYCKDNDPLVSFNDLIAEKIVRKYIIEIKEWLDGFVICE